MSERFAGLTRRINDFVHVRETSEELSHLVDEVREYNGDACDALIELALGDEHLDTLEADEYSEDDEMVAILEDDEDDEAGEDEIGEDEEDDEGDVDEDEVNSAESDLDELSDSCDEEDDEMLEESAFLRHNEVLVL